MILRFYSGWVSLSCHGIVTYMYDFTFFLGWVSFSCHGIMTYDFTFLRDGSVFNAIEGQKSQYRRREFRHCDLRSAVVPFQANGSGGQFLENFSMTTTLLCIFQTIQTAIIPV